MYVDDMLDDIPKIIASTERSTRIGIDSVSRVKSEEVSSVTMWKWRKVNIKWARTMAGAKLLTICVGSIFERNKTK